jgi:hypothetical protein
MIPRYQEGWLCDMGFQYVWLGISSGPRVFRNRRTEKARASISSHDAKMKRPLLRL